MKPVDSSQTVTPSTLLVQGNVSQEDVSMRSIPELPAQPASALNLKTYQSTEPLRPNRITQTAFSAIAIAMGMTFISGTVYVICNFFVAQLGAQQVQQSIRQRSAQMLQQDTEQRNMQQRLQAEHESNQRHLQLAQQALTQNDWSTGLREARQISNDPLWQQQRDSIIQKAEPSENEQQAKYFLDQGESANAIIEANKLPPIAPWVEKRSIIIEQANQRIAEKKIAEKWNDRCRKWTKDNISRCPNVEDIKTFEEILPTSWLSKFIPSSHKQRR